MHGGLDPVETGAQGGRQVARRYGMDLHGAGAGAGRLGQHRVDLQQRLFGARGHGQPAPGPQQPRPGDQGHDLLFREHQRRHVMARLHHVAQPGLALDRHARGLQIGHVAIDGAERHLQPLRQDAPGHQPPAAQMLHDLEQAVGAAHPQVPCMAGSNRPMRLPSGSWIIW